MQLNYLVNPKVILYLHGEDHFSFRLQVGVFAGDVVDAGARLVGVQVVVAYDQGAGVAPVKIFEQRAEGSLLFSRTRVGGLTADVEPAFVADAYRVGVVVHAVGTDQPFRTAWLDLSVTTDDVVVADTKMEASLAVPCVNLSNRTGLVGPHCRTMYNNQRDLSHNCKP